MFPRKRLHVIGEHHWNSRLIVHLPERISVAISAAMSHDEDWSISELNDQTVFTKMTLGEQVTGPQSLIHL